MFSPELDEKVVLPTRQHKTVGQIEAENSVKEAEQQETSQEIKETKVPPVVKETVVPSSPEKSVNAKVVVGYYATEKQAEVAKSIIQDAGLSVTPIVKNLGGYYTLQVGSYSSKEKAQQAANNLLKSNFPARVILD
jgi:cell division protein FtsN